MPNKQAAIKELRKSAKRNARNRSVKRNIKTLVKDSRTKLAAGIQEEKLIKDAIKAIDKAVQKKIMKKNAGARTKSRLMKKLNGLKKK